MRRGKRSKRTRKENVNIHHILNSFGGLYMFGFAIKRTRINDASARTTTTITFSCLVATGGAGAVDDMSEYTPFELRNGNV